MASSVGSRWDSAPLHRACSVHMVSGYVFREGEWGGLPYMHVVRVTVPEALKEVQSLLAAGADPDCRDGRGRTPLHEVAGNSPVTEKLTLLAEELLRAGADVNARDESGRTPLFVAAAHRQSALAWFLIEHGATVNESAGNATPLHAAVESDALNTVRALVEAGADVNAANGDRVSPLHLAWGTITAALLLDHGAAVNARAADGASPLHSAAGNVATRLEVIHLLLARGADANARDRNGTTPLHRSYQADVAKPLLAAGAYPDARDARGNSPLHAAAAKNLAYTIEILVNAGADPNARNNRGETPLQVALERRHRDAASRLRSVGAAE